MGTKIFKVEDGILVLVKEELRAIPIFKKILLRSKPIAGDIDGGRRKLMAYKEFMYIFYMCDPESPYATLDVKEQNRKAIRDCEMPEGWKPDDVVKDAMQVYTELWLDSTPSYRVLLSLEKGMHQTDKVIQTININLNNQLEKIQELMTINPQAAPELDNIVTALNTLMTISGKIPDTLDAIEQIREKVIKEKGGDMNTKRGGDEVSDRENPRYIGERTSMPSDEFADVADDES